MLSVHGLVFERDAQVVTGIWVVIVSVASLTVALAPASRGRE
ncbi:DUF2964 family protein [Burkholderia ubonensis]